MALFRFGKSSAESSPRTEEEPGAAKPSVFDRLRAGLSKTAQVLNTDVRDLLKQEGRHVDAAFLEELRGALVRTDMGPSAAEAIVKDVEERLRSRVVDPEVVVESIRRTLSEKLAGTTGDLATSSSGPTVILVTGVNGSGKTTSIAKLTRRFSEAGLRVVLGAGDTFRAAAVEQLSMWAGRLGAEIVRGEPNSDPASIAHRAVSQAVEGDFDICIIDTAGRLQNQSNLMQELGKIRRVISKQIPDAPHEVFLVIDATAGQNALSQAEGFKEAAGCTGIVLAKLDGSARGGVFVPVAERFGLPVKFVGLGESADDLATFDPESFVDAMLEGVLRP